MPLLKLAYLLTLAVGLFFLRDPWVLGGIAAAQLGLWALWRVPLHFLGRIARRLSIFLAVVALVHAFTQSRGETPSDWRALAFGLEVNVTGLWTALAMGLRVVGLVLASTWVQRSGNPGDLSKALIQARAPKRLAWSIDTTLTLLTAGGGPVGPGPAGAGGGRGGGGGGGGGGGRGGGGGGGGGRRDGAQKKPFTLAQLRRGDFGFLLDLLRSGLERAQAAIRREHPDLSPTLTRDLTIVTGIALAAMGLKMIQVMPGLPIAPGQKNLILLPFFILASAGTRSRLGGLWCAATVGLLSFFLGFGKYGILELGHFLAPGLLVDLLLPLVWGRGWLRWAQMALLGGLLGASRWTAQFLVILLAGDAFSRGGQAAEFRRRRGRPRTPREPIRSWYLLAIYSPDPPVPDRVSGYPLGSRERLPPGAGDRIESYRRRAALGSGRGGGGGGGQEEAEAAGAGRRNRHRDIRAGPAGRTPERRQAGS